MIKKLSMKKEYKYEASVSVELEVFFSPFYDGEVFFLFRKKYYIH